MNSIAFPLATLFGFEMSSLIPIVIPLGAFVLAGVIVVTGLYFHNRQREMWHQTARLALEKGQPLPPMNDGTDRKRLHAEGSPMNDLRGGLICIAVGMALYLFLGTFIGRGLGYVGAIPGFIGVALVLMAILRGFFEKRSESRDSHSPRA